MTTAYEGTATLSWTFGDRLRKIRLECTDLTQIGVAAVLGVSPATVGSWEAGRSTPGKHLVTVAQKIEQAWGVPAAWTVGIDPEPPVVRHQGLEPRTRWLIASPDQVNGDVTDGDQSEMTDSATAYGPYGGVAA